MIRVVFTSIILFFVSQYMIVGNKNIIPVRKSYLFYNFLCIFCVYSFLNMFLWNYVINFLIVITFFFILTLVMFYVHEFRGTNLNCADVLSINTAKEVASGYKYEIRSSFVVVLLFILLEYLFQVFFVKIDVFANYHKVINGIESINIDIYRFFWHEIGQFLAFFISFFILRDKVSDSKFDYSLCAGENEGYIYNFMSSLPILHKSNIDYTEVIFAAKQFIREVLSNIKNKDKKRTQSPYNIVMNKYKNYAYTTPDVPHIIVIMNESFGSVHRRVKTNQTVTPYYDNLTGVIKGNLYVNTFGGGTANTEFEFLTGMTIGNYPYPVMPYNNFVKRDKYSIARFFNNLGYKTIAMHPYTATNYHRNKVYKKFGFQDLVFFDDFKDKSYVRKFVSDESMYQEVIRRYRITKSQEKKMFLFGITMQNHSGYKSFDGAEILSFMKNYKERESLDSYLSLMKISDTAIKVLVDYFKQEEDHVIILFFGDHNASFGTELNKNLYNHSLHYEYTNTYETPFFIYDNKNSEDEFIKAISANFLSLELIKKANLPLDALHELLNDVYKKYSVYNFHKAKNKKNDVLVDIPNDRFMLLEKEYLK